MSIKKDGEGRLVYVEIRCGGRSGRCGTHTASIKDYFGHLVLVDHEMSDRKFPLRGGGFEGNLGEWHKLRSCPSHGEQMRRDGDDHWQELMVYTDELVQAVNVARRTNRTAVLPLVAWEEVQE